MDDPAERTAPPWSASPTAKEKNAVWRNVTALLDELAPERILSRTDRIKVPIEQYRAPTGCVLQAATAALSVSWFADEPNEASLGELHIVLWRGIVSRRGALPTRDAATIVRELVLRPIERPTNERVWRGTDGTEYDTASLAAHCLALLQAQMAASELTKPH